MAGRVGILTVTDVATDAVAKTLLQGIAAANHAMELAEVSIGFHGILNTLEPILVELVRQSDGGTSSAATPVKGDDSVADTLDMTGRHTCTAEPTGSDVVRAWSVHPQAGLIYPANPKAPIMVGAGDRLGLRVTAAATVKADATMIFVE